MKSENRAKIPNNLPLIDSVFVNRVDEIDQAVHLLNDPGVNIIMISGPAGIGKTAFAIRVVSTLQTENNRFPGGIVWLNCATYNTLPRILLVIAEVINLDSASLRSSMLRERVLNHLKKAHTLLIFDDYEKVAEDDSVLSFIGHVSRTTKIFILTRGSVTSRGNVRLPGYERGVALRLAPFGEEATMTLLRQQLKLFGLAEFDAETMQEIYRQTGGLPLALNYVISLIRRGLPPLEILEKFQEGIIPGEIFPKFLFDQAYNAFSTKQRQYLSALSIFAHPVEGATVASVAELEDWRLYIDDIVSKSFVEVIDGRYTLLPLTRAYLQNLVEHQELRTYQLRMVQYYLNYVVRFQSSFEQIDHEWPNIQYAIETAYQNELWQHFLKFVQNLGQFLTARGYEDEYQKWLEQALEVSKKIDDESARAGLLHNLAVLYQRREDFGRAAELYRQSLALTDATGDLIAKSVTLTNLGSVSRSENDFKNAIDYYERALAISRKIGDRSGEANILGNLGVSFADLGDQRKAATYYEQSLVISREVGDSHREANALGNLGTIYAGLGEYRLAIEYYGQALTISRKVGNRRGEATYLLNLGTTYIDLFEHTGSVENLNLAKQYFEQALGISRERGDQRIGANLYASLGTVYRELYARTGSAENLNLAKQYFEQALGISREIGDQRTEANLYTNLGTTYQELYTKTGSANNLHRAIQFFQQALEFFGAESYPSEYAIIQNNLGNIYALLNTGDKTENIEQAIIHYQEAIRVHPPDSPLMASSLSNLGSAFSERAQLRGNREDYLQAIDVLQQSLARTPPANPDWLRVASNLMKVYVEIGNWMEAKELSIQLLECVGIDYSSLETILPWYEGLGDLAIQNQDLDFATRIFAEVVRRFEIQNKKVPDAIKKKLVELREQLGDDRFVLVWAEAQGILKPVFAQKLHDARRLMNQELFSEAANQLSDALSILDEMEATKECNQQRAAVLFLRGFCLRKQGLWEEALHDQEQSFYLFENLRDYVGEAHTFLEMGYLFEVMNNYEDARLHYMDAYRLFRRADDKSGMASASENLGRLEYRVRMIPQAVQDLEEARRLYISVGDRTKAAAIDSDLDAAKTSLSYQAINDNKKDEKR